MKATDIIKHIEQIAPPDLAQDWDNTGLLVGDANKQIQNMLLTIDITKAVVAEAKKLKADMIISYHPVIWDGLKQVTADGTGSIVYKLVRAGIASQHVPGEPGGEKNSRDSGGRHNPTVSSAVRGMSGAWAWTSHLPKGGTCRPLCTAERRSKDTQTRCTAG